MTLTLEEFTADFGEEPGYLDFPFVGPMGSAVAAEEAANVSLLSHARFGALGVFREQDARVRAAVGALTGFPPGHVSFQPSASQGLMHTMFGVTGGVVLSLGEFPAVTFAVQRAADALGVVVPRWIVSAHGRVTPGEVREQLDNSVTVVVVSLVDFRTGHVADLEGIRQVIGDRMLVVDASQGFGVVDAPYQVADVVVANGYKWPRAGWGTAFLAVGERAVEHVTPVWSGFSATESDELPMDEVLPPARGARGLQVAHADPIAQARLATALERMDAVGVPTLAARVAEVSTRLIDIADRFAVPVASPRTEAERAGIVVLEPAPDQFTALVAALHNHGVTTTLRRGQVRLGGHVSTGEETFAMLSAALLSYSTGLTR